MSKARFQFGNVVVVDTDQIGVIVKTWRSGKNGYLYQVYVRSYNGIGEYDEDKINHFVYSKELHEGEGEFY